MDVVVVGAGRCTSHGMTSHARRRRERGVCRVDLSGAQFVDPFGLVVAASVVDRAVRRGETVRFTAPDDVSVRRYTARMNLCTLLDDVDVVHDLEYVRHHDTGERLVELARFTGTSEASALTTRISNIFAPVDKDVAFALCAAVDEITDNVIEHSRGNRDEGASGFLALQQYGRNSREVEFAVGDSGVGLLATLSTTAPCETDAEAIAVAVQRRSSRHGSRAGVGLSRVLQIATERGGDVRIWSGDAFSIFRQPSGSPTATRYPAGRFFGAAVHARIEVR